MPAAFRLEMYGRPAMLVGCLTALKTNCWKRPGNAVTELAMANV
jgi:hypothetical protein